MAIPTLPAIAGYTLYESVEHPNFYIGCYRKISGNLYRILTYTKSALHPNGALTVTYNVFDPNSAAPRQGVVDSSGILWLTHFTNGLESYSFNPSTGITTRIQHITHDIGSGKGYDSLYVTDSHVIVAQGTAGIKWFTKTGVGTVNTTSIAHVYNDSQKYYSMFGTSEGNLLIARSESNALRYLNIATGASLTRTHGGVSNPSSITMDWANDAHTTRERFIKWTVSGKPGFNYVNSDTTIEPVINWNKGDGSYYDQVNTIGPIAYYPCNDTSGNIVDVVSRNDLSITGGGITLGNTGLVNGDTAVYFSGTQGQYATTASNLFLSGETQGSCEYWVKLSANSGTNVYVSLVDATATVRFTFQNDATDSPFIVRSNGVTAFVQLWNVLKLNKWTHVVITCNFATNVGAIYINSVKLGTVDVTALAPWQAPMRLTLGNYYPSASGDNFPMTGFLQHVAVYNIELSESQIIANYNKGNPQTITGNNAYENLVLADKPVCYYPMDETTGGVVYDRMKREDLTIQGGSADTMTSTGINESDVAQPCLNFNGTSQYLISDQGLQTLGHFDAMTIEALVRVGVHNSSNSRGIATASETGGWLLQLDGSGYLSPYFYVNGAWHGTADTPPEGNSIDNTEIAHLASVYDGRYVKGYVNGILQRDIDSGGVNPVDYTTLLKFVIGAQWDPNGIPTKFTGKIAHVAIHDKAISQNTLRKRWLTAVGYDTDNPTAYQAAVITNKPVMFIPCEDQENNSATVAAYAYQAGWNLTRIPDLNIGSGCVKGQPTVMPTGSGSISSGTGIWASVNSAHTAKHQLTGNITFEFWANFSSLGPKNTLGISYAAYGESQNTNVLYQFIVYSSGSLSALWEYGNGSNVGPYISAEDLFKFNKVQHVVFRRNDDTKNMSIFVNGVKVLSQTYTNSATGGDTGRFGFGHSYETTPNPEYYGFIGNVQNIAMYDSALTDADIANHYALGIADVGSFEYKVIKSQPYTRWRLNEKSSSLVDEYGHASYSAQNIIVDEPALNKSSERSIKFVDGNTDHGRATVGILANRTTWTIEAWIQIDENSSGLIYTEAYPSFSGLRLSLENGEIKTKFRDISNWAADVITSGLVLPYNQPIHIVWVRDVINGYIYINGVLKHQGSYGAARGNNPVLPTARSAIGANAGTTEDYVGFGGIIDDVIIYRKVLTATEILDHYITGALGTDYNKLVNRLLPSFYVSYDRGIE